MIRGALISQRACTVPATCHGVPGKHSPQCGRQHAQRRVRLWIDRGAWCLGRQTHGIPEGGRTLCCCAMLQHACALLESPSCHEACTAADRERKRDNTCPRRMHRTHLQPQDGMHVQMVGRLILEGGRVHQVSQLSLVRPPQASHIQTSVGCASGPSLAESKACAPPVSACQTG